MSAGDLFLVVVRWLHLVAGAAWVGGSLFYLFVLRPAVRRSPPDSSGIISAAAAAEFRAVVETAILVLVATGVILTVNRLTPGVAGVPYVATLGVKIALSVLMFSLALGRRKRPLMMEGQPQQDESPGRLARVLRSVSGYNALVILGVIVFLVSDLLKVLYEMALQG